MNVEEIAQQAGGEVTGDSQPQITGVAEFEVAGPTLSHLRIVRPLLRGLRPHAANTFQFSPELRCPAWLSELHA